MVSYWQHFEAPTADPAVWTESYAAPMPDGSRLVLPLRDLGDTAVAGLIANQASFQVVDRLSQWMAEAVAAEAVDIVVGLPTLGHVFGQGVARALGHTQWVAPGTTRKLWYIETLSVPTASITSPEGGRRMWLDPRLLDRLTGRRVLLVDDVISTGRSAMAGLALLSAAGVRPVAGCVAMAQTGRWQEQWPADIPMHSAFATPLFRRSLGGWQPEGGPLS
jgi:adenine/guanine phosphoribosyltransferase-like PRPP-binding protein